MSMPFFVHPRAEVDLTPLAGCVEKLGANPKYRSISAGEYFMERLTEIGFGNAMSSSGPRPIA